MTPADCSKLLLIAVVLHYVVIGKPSLYSKNITGVVDTSLTLTCWTNNSNQVRWKHHSYVLKTSHNVYNGFTMPDHLRLRYEVDFNQTYRSNKLTILNVQPSDAGVFSCQDLDTEDEINFDLVVLDSTPVCHINATFPVKLDDVLLIGCSVNFTGSWTPTIHCIPDVYGQLVVNQTAWNYLKYAKILKISADIEGKSFVCRSGASPDPADQFETYTWMSQPVQIFRSSTEKVRQLDNYDEPRGNTTYMMMMSIILTLAVLLALSVVAIVIVVVRNKKNSAGDMGKYDPNVSYNVQRPGSLSSQNYPVEFNHASTAAKNSRDVTGAGSEHYLEIVDTSGHTLSATHATDDNPVATCHADSKCSYEGLDPCDVAEPPTLIPRVYDDLRDKQMTQHLETCHPNKPKCPLPNVPPVGVTQQSA